MMIAPGQIAPRDLPALPLASRAGLPECAAIYFVIADDGEILYVGRAITLRSRWTAHHRREELEALGGVRIAWLEVSDAALLPSIEDACVEHFAPRLNGTRVPASPGGHGYKLTVRVPDDLHDDLTAMRKEHLRTLQAQMVWCMRECAEQWKREKRRKK